MRAIFFPGALAPTNPTRFLPLMFGLLALLTHCASGQIPYRTQAEPPTVASERTGNGAQSMRLNQWCQAQSDEELDALLDGNLSDLRNQIVIPAPRPSQSPASSSESASVELPLNRQRVPTTPVSFQIGDTSAQPGVPASLTRNAVQGSHTSSNAEQPDAAGDDLDSLLDSDVTQLRNTTVAPSLQVEVSSVSRQKSTVGRSPAAVFVITQEMIRRSGARSLAELLRMVPGLHVGKVSSHQWAVSSRGFIDTYTKQLLVQIDGRSIYTPIFGGVVWSWHDLLLDDIERIEVIRGPGSTIWGANAVNGVINIITKNAADTTGLLAEAGGGTEHRAFGGTRVGGTTPHGVSWRISTKGFDRDAGFEPGGIEVDSWDQGRVNFRADWDRGGDRFTVQGGAFSGNNGIAQNSPFFPLVLNETPVNGSNLLVRWTRPHSEDSESSLQVWYDRYNSGNSNDIVIGQQSTFDIDFQNRFRWCDRHRLIWGLGYRSVWDELIGGTAVPTISFDPVRRRANLVSGFIQDEFEVQPDKLFFTLGTKLSHNDYSHSEVQPSARLLWVVDDRSVMWTAVSRAVRVPARTQSDVNIVMIPGLLNLRGFPGNDAEPLIAYEWGYRKQPVKWFSWDATVFYHDYDDLIVSVATAPGTLTLLNALDSTGYGAELAGQLDLTGRWKIRSWYSFLHLCDDALLPFAAPTVSPRNQAFLMSSLDLGCHSELDLIARYVDDLRREDVPAYVQADVRYAWRPNRNVELSIVGQNLLNENHLEYVGSQFTAEVATQAERGVYGMIQIRY